MTILEKYIKHLLKFKGLNPKHSDVMIAILEEYKMTCMSKNQLKFVLAKSNKENIAGKTGLSISRINHLISDFIKADLLKRESNGTYCLNSDYFYCDEFNQIYEIKAKYNYITRTVSVDFVRA